MGTEKQHSCGEQENSPVYYPVMLDLRGRTCLIVGGGRIAERKAGSLLEAGARVTLVSPEVTPQLGEWEAQGLVQLLREPYRPGLRELREACLVFAATDNRQVNEQVRLEAEANGRLVNTVDEQDGGSFIVPAAVRRGRLTLAVSTAGASPALAAAIRRQLEGHFDEAYAPYLELMHELRQLIRRAAGTQALRQELLRSMLDWPLLQLCSQLSGSELSRLREELLRLTSENPTPQGMGEIGQWLYRQVPAAE